MIMEIRILRVVEETTVDGPGFRTSVYCAGCRHACPGCHNPQSWPMTGGEPRSTDDLARQILADPFSDVTFTGGDPFYQAAAFAELAAKIKAESRKTIWCYTGFLFEELVDAPQYRPLLERLDVLVDGPFVMAERDESLLFRGSRNQRIIDVPASLREGKAVEFRLDTEPFS
ncbi:MAG: anaerobic ribonucleoside-triphosphate reductase activating protein [Bacteroidaceae bacterium]|nr:anaerobic ribonucleoside-triphosphate reductase activating protein [Prevotellaceae bacterium]MDY5632885.1 anaerobic ribonucleoside-triphosphate reductase activating protein [Bacteroidaceae bacterium]